MKTLFLPALFALLIITPVFFVNTDSAQALSCVPLPENLLERGDVIFAGTVESITRSPDEAEGDFGIRAGGTATFAVSKYWKGHSGASVTVHNIYAWGMEGPYFKKGAEYIVFARKDASGTTTTLYANIDCGSTAPASKEVSDELNEIISGRAPVAPLPVELFSRNLTLGDNGSDVALLQSFLEERGILVIPTGVPKGYFGGLTKTALSRYQAAQGITPAYGYFGPITREAIKKAMTDKAGVI